MKTILMAVLAFLVSANSIVAQSHPLVVRQVVVSTVGERSAFDIPPGADLDRFPLMSGPLSMKQVAELGLRPYILPEDVTVWNWHGELGRFVWEVIPAGTLVLVDQDNEIRYRQDCGNRLVVLDELVETFTPVDSLVTVPVLPGDSISAVPETNENQGPVTRLGDSLKESAKTAWGVVGNLIVPPARAAGWFLALIAGVLILPAAAYVIWRLIP